MAAEPLDEEDDDVIVAPPRRAARPAEQAQPSRSRYQAREQYEEQYEEQYDQGEEDPRDVIAGRIIRWAPPITAVLCAIIAAVGFLLTL